MRVRSLLILLAAVASAACNDTLGVQPWNDVPDTTNLFSASRADFIGLPSAYDFANITPVRIEAAGAAGNWDVVLTEANGQLQLTPAGAFEGQQTSRAGIATITGKTFADLKEAPSDTSQYSHGPVTLTQGGIYVVRSRVVACSFTTSVYYSKLVALTVDATNGQARFAFVRNPYCGNRSFVPPKN